MSTPRGIRTNNNSAHANRQKGYLMKMRTLIGFGAALMLAGAAQAQTIYSNGAGPDYNNGNEMAQWAQAEDFTGVDGEITDVHYSVLDSQGGLAGWDGTIQWAIYEGDPNANNVVGSGNAVNITTTFDQNANGFDFFFVDFDLDNSVNVTAANTYWLALHMGSDFVSDGLFWATQDANGTATGLESNGSFDGPWTDNFTEHYFELTTPAPGALALLALAGLVARRRRR